LHRVTDRLTVGERVAWYRRRRGMSQETLAGLVGRTTDWLQKAERNRIELDRLSVLRELARALSVSLAELLSEPVPIVETSASRRQGISALRKTLTDYRQITPLLASQIDQEPPTPKRVQEVVGSVWSSYQDSRYRYALSRLPALLVDAQSATDGSRGSERRRAYAMLALSYHASAALLTKLGEVDLAWIAADRGLMAAQEADDLVVAGSLFRSVAHALLSTGRYAEAVGIVDDAASYLRTHRVLETPTGVAVYGTLFLAGAMAAARMNDRQATDAHLSEASAAAQQLNHDANHMWTAFGPTNVAVHRVATAMELGDTRLAIDLGTRVDPVMLPIERRVRHALELARAQMRRNQREHSLSILLDAERLAPEQVRAHFLAKQLAHTLVRTQRGRPNAKVTGFVTRMQVLD
jgi:transcriptional regulator with XRE-family HTH domain